MKKYTKKDNALLTKLILGYTDKHIHLKPKQTAKDCFEDYPYIKTKFGVDYEIRGFDAEDYIISFMGAFQGGPEKYAEINKAGIDCNPYTGKWNFHFPNGTTIQDAAEFIIMNLRKIAL